MPGSVFRSLVGREVALAAADGIEPMRLAKEKLQRETQWCSGALSMPNVIIVRFFAQLRSTSRETCGDATVCSMTLERLTDRTHIYALRAVGFVMKAGVVFKSTLSADK